MRELQYDFDWISYIEDHFDYARASNGEYRINCVHCGNDKKKLYVNTGKCFFNCFACDFRSGRKFDLTDLIAKTENISKAQALMRLISEYQPTTPADIASALREKLTEREESSGYTIRTIEGLPANAVPIKQVTDKHPWDYLLGRGLTEKEILACNIHYIPESKSPVHDESGNYKGDIGKRVIFPVYGGNHDLISWQARTTDRSYTRGDKYLFCPGTDANKTLWPYVKPYSDHVVIQEGILDVLALRRVGKPMSSYACFSKHISIDQIKLLKSWGVDKVTVFFDIRDAKKQIVSTVEVLKMHFSKVYVVDKWAPEIDAGDCLRLEDGLERLKQVTNNLVDVYSLHYEKWKLTN